MASKIFHLAKVASELPFPVLVTRGLHRLGLKSAWSRRIDFLHSEDTKRPVKAVKILLDSLRQADLTAAPLAERIPNGRVLEIGCGRHAGLAPFALGLGAREYVGVDPSLDANLFRHSAVHRHYLEPATIAAKALASELPDFNHLPFRFSGLNGVDEMLARCRFEKSGIGELGDEEDKADICVSISCLEHIRGFAQASRAMAKISHARTIHIHVVNFSNHLSKKAPFHQLYEMPYAEFGRRWNYNVNGLRVSDMLRELENAGLNLRAIPLDRRFEALPERIDATWLERYDHQELALRTAVLTTL